MAKIIHCHPSKATNEYHIYTDLDFWDTRLILKDLATVKRNFGTDPPGNDYPTQVVGDDLNRSAKATIEKRLRKASLVFGSIEMEEMGTPEGRPRDISLQVRPSSSE